MSNSNKPISGFIASLLNLALIIIVLKVIMIWAESERTGTETNMAKVAATEVRVFWSDIKEGWSAEKDTTE